MQGHTKVRRGVYEVESAAFLHFGQHPPTRSLGSSMTPSATLTTTTLPPEAIARALPDAVPENAPAHCPGTESEEAGKASACQGCPNQDVCATTPKGPDVDLPRIAERMQNVRNKVLIMSGKGGVGKSTFTAMLAWACSMKRETQVSSVKWRRQTSIHLHPSL